MLTQGTVGLVGEARKGLGLLGVLGERSGGLAGGRAGGGSASCPSFIQENAQPQEDYQQEIMDKEGVYPSVSFSGEKTMIDYLIRRRETYPQAGGTRPAPALSN
jgi:hypothetical protein